VNDGPSAVILATVTLTGPLAAPEGTVVTIWVSLQLLIVVASPMPLKALRFDRPVAADRVFAAALGEAERTNQPVAAMARYFKLER